MCFFVQNLQCFFCKGLTWLELLFMCVTSNFYSNLNVSKKFGTLVYHNYVVIVISTESSIIGTCVVVYFVWQILPFILKCIICRQIKDSVNIFIVKYFLTHCVCANALKLAIKVRGLHIFVSQHLWFCAHAACVWCFLFVSFKH